MPGQTSSIFWCRFSGRNGIQGVWRKCRRVAPTRRSGTVTSTVLVMRKRSVMVISALVGLLLAGCGSAASTNSSGSSSALRRINAAVGLTEATGSAHLVTSSDTSGPSSAGSSANDAAIHLTSVGDIRFAGPDLRLTTTAQSGRSAPSTSTAIYVGNYLYINESSDQHGWVRAPYRQTYPYLGAVQTTALTTTTGPVTAVGSDDVDGQPSTKYLVPMPGSMKTSSLTNSKNQPYDEHINTAPFVLSVWLDRAGRIVRTQATQKVTISPASRVAVETSTTTLSDFGETIQISAPTNLVGQ